MTTSGGNTAVNTLTFIPFDSPVGTEQERRSQKIYPGRWRDDNPFKTHYVYDTSEGQKEANHTGSDLNLPAGDENEPVFAVADGTVTFAGELRIWGNVIVIKHADTLFSRYGHVQNMQVESGDPVTRGQHIAHVGKAPGMPFHLHFDISHTAVLETKPKHWPGLDLVELEANYVDPADYIRTHRPVVRVEESGVAGVTEFLWVGRVKPTLGLNLRMEPSTAGTKIRALTFGSLVHVLEELGEWCRVRADDDEGFVFAEFLDRIDG